MKLSIVILALFFQVLFPAIAPALTLDDAVRMGQQRSLQMQDPQIDRQKINGQIMEAWSNALPQIDGQAAYQRVWKSQVLYFPMDANDPTKLAKIPIQQDNGATANATLNQPLFTFGRIGAGLKAAYAAKRSNEHITANTSRTVELEVMRRYWTVLLMKDVLEARRSSAAISDSSVAKAQRMRAVGLMSDYDVLRFQVQANNQVPPLRQAENQLRLSELSLTDYLGIPLDTSFSVDGSLDHYEAQARLDTATGDVLHRDDLEALRDLTTMNKNIYKIFNAQNWPVLAAQFQYQWQWANNSWTVNSMNSGTSYYGGLALTIPIWTSGKYYGQAQQYKSDWKKSELQLQKAERGAQVQYEAAVRAFRTATASESAAELAVQQAQEARRIAQTKLEQGQITPLEMDAAQLDELVAKVALAQARYDRLVAAAETRMAAGLPPYLK
jgi:HAE1 family hydrophobic/amphiphilic exporter-1